MKYLILGGVAAGTKTAAKLKREDRTADVKILVKGKDISYAGCGLPYYVGGLIESREELIVNTPKAYSDLTGVEVITETEAVSVNTEAHTVNAKNLTTGKINVYSYDKLVIATGAYPSFPEIDGINGKDGVFKVRTPDDAAEIKAYVSKNAVKRAIIVGAGFIGLEMAENLNGLGIKCTVVDIASQVLPEIVDKEIALYIRKQLIKNGIQVITGTKVSGVVGDSAVSAVRAMTGLLPCDMLILAAGIRPNTAFLEGSGIELYKGTVVTDEHMQTNVESIYAVGDCALVKNRITGQSKWSPMGSSANLEGRTLAQYLSGKDKSFPGVLGTGIVKLPGINVGRTGLTEKQAIEAGYNVVTALAVTDDKAHYYPDSSYFVTKLIADRDTHMLLGAQVLGPGNVDKMIDIAVTGLNLKAKLEEFENADYAYAPPFSTAIHPFVQAVYILLNKLDGTLVSITPAEFLDGKADDYRIIDVSKSPAIPGAYFVNLTEVNGELPGIDKNEKLLLVCTRGKRGYLLQNRLRHFGYVNTAVLEGATFFNDVKVKNVSSTVSPEDVTRVKALGFLRDKRTSDKFNGRVITRNGKITADESKVIAQAAEIYGSGEITMTSRLTLEIQGVPYDNIEPLREFLSQYGLETGGTGSKVRPVVSCKGTTCQYGLIDTFALSEEIHERFFHGYSNVKLPHKFKIAVGGCPNNCVKPDLNDLGIIGQKVPQVNLEKCRGCKKCAIAEACPIKAVSVIDGKAVINLDECNHCGRCVGKCPFKAFEDYTPGYKVYIGGRWGKKVAQGKAIPKIFSDSNEVLDVVEKAILLFREQGITGERFADTVARLGFDNVCEQLLSDGLLERKDENLNAVKHVKGGATC